MRKLSQPKGISEIEFESADREAKGAATEDSGLRILASMAKQYRHEIFIVERASPHGIGEFDAIVCTDSGLIVVDLKRYGGCFWPFKITDQQACIQVRGQDKWIPNPAFKLHHKVERLRSQLLNNDLNWLPVKRLFSGSIRVHSIVCFGPSTKFDEVPAPTKNFTICNTRNLASTIESIYASNTGVIGAGQQLAGLVALWPQWGVLTTHRKGFLRAALARISSSKWDITPQGLVRLSSDGAKLSYEFATGRKGKLAFDQVLHIKTYVDGSEKTISIPPGSRFRWRVTGR